MVCLSRDTSHHLCMKIDLLQRRWCKLPISPYMVKMPLLTTSRGTLDQQLTTESVAMVLPSDALKAAWLAVSVYIVHPLSIKMAVCQPAQPSAKPATAQEMLKKGALLLYVVYYTTTFSSFKFMLF